MFAICLIFSGIAFFLNGFLPLIDENDNNEIVIMNVLSGLIISFLCIYGIFVAVDTATYLNYASLLLFGITHLFIAGVGIWDLSEESLGWLSLLLTIIALGLGIYFLMAGVSTLGFAWLIWMFIWLAYFLSRALGVLKTASSWVIMLEGVLALVLVGMLVLTGNVAIL